METVVNRGFRGEVSQLVEFYNLDAIISVGYRVNSAKATRFRQWATAVLRDFAIRGYVLDRKRFFSQFVFNKLQRKTGSEYCHLQITLQK